MLVNNAGVLCAGALADVGIGDWNALLAVNLTGYLLCARAFGAPMRLAGRASMSSMMMNMVPRAPGLKELALYGKGINVTSCKALAARLTVARRATRIRISGLPEGVPPPDHCAGDAAEQGCGDVRFAGAC